MKATLTTITDPAVLRATASQSSLVSAQLYETEPNGHLYRVGDTLTLVGLESFPEFNGETVEVTGIREDGSAGRAYYVKGRINQFLNWVYEYRLQDSRN